MTTEPTPFSEAPHRAQAGSVMECAAALIEVLLAFSLVHLAYRPFKHFTALGRQEGVAGLNFSPGTVMILVTVAVLLVSRRNFGAYGLTFKGWRSHLNVGVLWGVLVVLAAGAVVPFGLVHFDPLHPPDLPRAAVFSFGEVLLMLLLVVFLMRERSLVRRVPPVISLLVLIGLVSLPVVLAVLVHRGVLHTLLRVLWLFVGAGFGEEIFFRGYIQSRLNQSLGRPWRVFRLQFGVGLMVSSLLFGFIHALNTVDYFSGRFEFAWLWWARTSAPGCSSGAYGSEPGVCCRGRSFTLSRTCWRKFPACWGDRRDC